MRRTTIVRIGLVLGVVFGGGWIILLATGSESERHDAAGGLVAILTIGALLFAGWWFRVRPRRDFHRRRRASSGSGALPATPSTSWIEGSFSFGGWLP